MRLRLFGAVCACLLVTPVFPTHAVTINYSSIPGASIQLDPTNGCGGIGSEGCFSFLPDTSGYSLQIDSGMAVGAQGHISGTFAVGAITSSGSAETAPVTGTGGLSIFDGTDTLTASLEWMTIATLGTGGILNVEGMANLTSIAYAGSNADLLALFNAGTGTQTATFQFTNPTSLTDLFNAASPSTTSFSGSITPVPLPAAAWLLVSGFAGLTLVKRRKVAA